MSKNSNVNMNPVDDKKELLQVSLVALIYGHRNRFFNFFKEDYDV